MIEMKDFIFELYNNICVITVMNKDNEYIQNFLNTYVTGYEEVKETVGGFTKKSKSPVALYMELNKGADKTVYTFPRGLYDMIPEEVRKSIPDFVDKTTNDMNVKLSLSDKDKKAMASILQPESGFDLREDQYIAVIKALKLKRGLIQYPTGCLIGSTEIMLSNDITVTMEEMFINKKDYIGKTVYSVDKEGQPQFDGKIKNVFLTKMTDTLMEVVMDNDKKIYCTENHPFLIGTDEYKEANQLVKGEEIISLYFKDFEIGLLDKIGRKIGKSESKIKEINLIRLDKPIAVYDIEVEEYHNFVVMTSENKGIVVHNSGKTEIMSSIIKRITKEYPESKAVVIEPTDILVKNTTKRFQRYGIDAVTYKSTREDIQNNVVVSHPMALLNDLQKNPKLLEDINCIFWDECLNKSAKIMLPNGKEMTIKNVYENPTVTEVVSYNLETNKYEIKKIKRKIRTEHNDYFWRLNYINPITGKLEWLCATPNHKIWTYNRGYVELQNLTEDDYIKVDVSIKTSVYRCNYCGKEFTSNSALGGHIAWCKSNGNYELTDNNLEEAEMFLLNHKVKVHSIKKNVGRKGEFRYNLEIEDNHNYFANNILVSNCHHVSCSTWSYLNTCIPNAEYSIAFSALAITKEHKNITDLSILEVDEALVLGAVSRMICETSPRYYIDKGILACPIVIQFKARIIKTFMTNNNWSMLRKMVLESYDRLIIGLRAVEVLNKYDRRSLILVDTKNQAYKVLQLFIDELNTKSSIGIAFGGGVGLELDKEEYLRIREDPNEIRKITNKTKKSEALRKQMNKLIKCLKPVSNITDKFDNKEFKVLIATTVADEGLDVDSLDAVLLISAGKKDRRFIQRVGRAIRKSKTGKFGYIFDLNDSGNKILEYHSKERMKIYREVIEAYDKCIFENFDVYDFEYLFKKLENITDVHNSKGKLLGQQLSLNF